MKLKLKNRLFLYNIMIIVCSSLFLIFIFTYINQNSKEILYNINENTVDERSQIIKELLDPKKESEEVQKNLQPFNYKLYVYDNKELIYGTNNDTLNLLLKKYHYKGNQTRILFVDNRTIVMKNIDNKIYFAVQEKFKVQKKPHDVNHISPFRKFLLTIIILIIIILFLLLFITIYLSNNLLKKVIEPLNLLKEGASRVENGDFSQPIIYEIDDEFAPVINNFNNMQQSLKEKTIKQQQYEKAKQEMISGISHDIRTPLTVVKGNIKGIQDGVAKTQVKQKEYLNIAYNRTIDIENLLNRLFDTFKYETNEIKTHKEEVDIIAYIDELIKNNEHYLNKHFKVITSCSQINNKIFIDKLQFKRIFDNLFNNAVKHNPTKKDLKININISEENNQLIIIFKDNGQGIKENNCEKIFNEFFKEDESRNNDKNSSGLGLFIVKKIIELHNGTITAENDDGLKFTIILKEDTNDENFNS